MNPAELAQEVLASRADHATMIPPSSRLESFSLNDGYAVALEAIRRRLATGEKVVGHKLGFTNMAAWAQLGLERPVWSRVYDTTVHRAPSNAFRLTLEGEHLAKIEPEIVFKLGAPLPDADDPAVLLGAVEWYALGLEIVQSRFPDWQFRPADAVADLVFHSALVIGEPHRLEPGSASRLETFSLRLERDGEAAASGRGTDVLGSPAKALGWLARLLRDLKLEPAQPGEVITTGTITPAMPIRRGETWTATPDGLALPALRLELT